MIGKALGHYRISSRPGRGAMGEVYPADGLQSEPKGRVQVPSLTCR